MNEANTQAEFYHQCRLIGLPVELELVTPAGRLDIAVLNEDRTRLLVIVECKKDKSYIREHSWQFRRYQEIGVPFYWLNKFSATKELVDLINEKHRHDEGIALLAIRELPRTVRGRRTKYA